MNKPRNITLIRLALVVLLCLISLPGIIQSIQQDRDCYVSPSPKNIRIPDTASLNAHKILTHYSAADPVWRRSLLSKVESEYTGRTIGHESSIEVETVANEFLYSGLYILKLRCTTLIAGWNLLCKSTTQDNPNEYKGKPPQPYLF